MADVFKTQLREQQRRKEMELETRAREKLELARVISTLHIYGQISTVSTASYLQ